MAKDPYEMHNLAGDAKFASVVEQLRGKLRAWMDQQGDEGLAKEVAANQRQWRSVRNKRRQQD